MKQKLKRRGVIEGIGREGKRQKNEGDKRGGKNRE